MDVPPRSDSLWYFAYGSNLDPQTFLGRRRMRPSAATVAVLPEHTLAFDLPIGKGERGVANVHPDPASRVHGVAYRITAAQAAWLDRTEGVGAGAYRRIEVRLEVDGRETLAAYTYRSSWTRSGRKPSRRYMGLILRGAHHHQLPDAWIQQLDAFELAVDERDPSPEPLL